MSDGQLATGAAGKPRLPGLYDHLVEVLVGPLLSGANAGSGSIDYEKDLPTLRKELEIATVEVDKLMLASKVAVTLEEKVAHALKAARERQKLLLIACDRKAAVFRPIARLPNELLVEILYRARRNQRDLDRIGWARSPLPIVCKLWRELQHTDGRFWANILWSPSQNVRGAYGPAANPMDLRDHLSLNKAFSLSIDANFADFEVDSSWESASSELFLNSQSRWRRLKIHGAFGSESLRFLSTGFQSVEELNLGSCNWPFTLKKNIPSTLQNMENVKVAVVDNCSFDALGHLLLGATDLTIKFVEFMIFIKHGVPPPRVDLSPCTQLTRLVLTKHEDDCVTLDLSGVTFTSLSTLRIASSTFQDFIDCVETISAPSVTSFGLRILRPRNVFARVFGAEALANFLTAVSTKWPGLQQLRIDDRMDDLALSQGLSRTLVQFSELQSFILVHDTSNQSSQSIPSRVADINHDLLSSLTPKDTGACACPKLESLHWDLSSPAILPLLLVFVHLRLISQDIVPLRQVTFRANAEDPQMDCALLGLYVHDVYDLNKATTNNTE